MANQELTGVVSDGLCAMRLLLSDFSGIAHLQGRVKPSKRLPS